MNRIAIFHPTSLLGKEVRETLERRSGWQEIRLLSTSEDEIGTLTEVAGAAALVQAYDADGAGGLDGIDTAFFCGPIAATRAVLAELPADTTAVVLSLDATTEDGVPVVAGVNDHAIRPGGVLLSPHPAVVLLSHLLHPLAGLDPQQAVATVLLPASMEGDPGIEELAEQARNIFIMSGRKPSPIFGAQLTFNVLPTALPADPLAAELAAVLGRPVALQVLQAGVFHSLAVSLHVRLEGASAQAIRKALDANPHLELADDPRHLGPVAAAASEKVIYGTVRKDPGGGFWLWAVMDNLTRGGALNAIEIAESV